MTEFKLKELPHLKNAIPDDIVGYSLGFYSIALEAWRRGLNVKFINRSIEKKPTVRYEISSGEKKFEFVGSRNITLTKKATKVTSNKQKTKEHLTLNNVPVAKGKNFSTNQTNEIICEYAKELGFPLVIKPITGRAGIGVIAGIESVEEFEKSLIYVRENLGYKNIIVEQHFEGEDYRVFVVGQEVVAITKRYPANVVGNGIQTIRQLIKEKNQLRKNHPMLSSSSIKIDKELQDMLHKQNLNLDSIPSPEQLIRLKSKNNISSGGDPVDITDRVSDELKQIAIKAIEAIPGLQSGGVDLMVNEEQNTAIVLEVNVQASIRSHLYPFYGKPRDIPSKIIDLYFPETKPIKRNDMIYFEFNRIWDLFIKGIVHEYTLPLVQVHNVISKKIIIKGSTQQINFGKWIRKNARTLKVHGYVKQNKNGTTEIAMLGSKESVFYIENLIKNNPLENIRIDEIVEKKLSNPIPGGFKIINSKLDHKLKDGFYPEKVEGITKYYRIENEKTKENKKASNTNDISNKQQLASQSNGKAKQQAVLARIIKKIFK